MLLSVAMIVKDEEKNIEKCLDAINCLKSQLDLEIVIVDTGSVDNTIELASKYTNKIYCHKWENDFAKMRNISLGYCTGEWILILDADEELINPWQVISFFSQGLCNQYNSATVNIKSSNSEEDESYTITPIVRLFRNTETLRYIGNIHEQPKYCLPTCTTSIELNHTGYYLDDYKLRKRKFERNSKFLLDRLNEKGEDVYTYYQLYSTYLMYDNRKQAIWYLLKAEQLARKSSDLSKFIYVLQSKANELYKSGDYISAAEKYEEILEICPCNIDAMYVLIQCYIQESEMKKADLLIDKYISAVDDEKTWIKMKSSGIESEFYNKKDQLIDIKVKILYQSGEYERIIEIFRNSDNMDYKIFWIPMFINSAMKNGQYEILAFELNKLVEYNSNLVDDILKCLNNILLFEKDDIKYYILDLLCEKNAILCSYIKVLYENEVSKDLIENINFNNYSDVKAEILKNISHARENIFEILVVLNQTDMKQYLNYLCNYYEIIEIMNKFSLKTLSSRNYYELILQRNIDLSLLGCGKISKEDMVSIAFRIIINNEYYIRCSKYEKDKFSIFLHELYINMGKMNVNLLEGIRNIKIIAKKSNADPQILKAVINYIGSIPEDDIIFNINKDKENIINKVIELINSGNEERLLEAQKILHEVKNILKFDFTIYNLAGVADFMQGNVDSALFNFNMAIMFNNNDYDSIYSIGQIMLENNKFDNAAYYFRYIINNSNNIELTDVCKNIIENYNI